eukprot:GHUV01039616.1.p1 GENE.GHUV01039616.1~~GHUV01039616.1.p1  ORF type:complete len:118 (-),score=16.56 GHUV01039616.1:144-497(-)
MSVSSCIGLTGSKGAQIIAAVSLVTLLPADSACCGVGMSQTAHKCHWCVPTAIHKRALQQTQQAYQQHPRQPSSSTDQVGPSVSQFGCTPMHGATRVRSAAWSWVGLPRLAVAPLLP